MFYKWTKKLTDFFTSELIKSVKSTGITSLYNT